MRAYCIPLDNTIHMYSGITYIYICMYIPVIIFMTNQINKRVVYFPHFYCLYCDNVMLMKVVYMVIYRMFTSGNLRKCKKI